MAKKKQTRKRGSAAASAKGMAAVRAAMAAWGRKGGKARKKALSPKRRRQIALKAIRTRWSRRGKRRPAGS
jgi:hypothetical protein